MKSMAMVLAALLPFFAHAEEMGAINVVGEVLGNVGTSGFDYLYASDTTDQDNNADSAYILCEFASYTGYEGGLYMTNSTVTNFTEGATYLIYGWASLDDVIENTRNFVTFTMAAAGGVRASVTDSDNGEWWGVNTELLGVAVYWVTNGPAATVQLKASCQGRSNWDIYYKSLIVTRIR